MSELLPCVGCARLRRDLATAKGESALFQQGCGELIHLLFDAWVDWAATEIVGGRRVAGGHPILERVRAALIKAGVIDEDGHEIRYDEDGVALDTPEEPN